MVVVLFRSRLRADAGPAYAPLAERMLGLAQAMPGFVSFRHYTAADGERVAIVEFSSHEAAAAWRDHPEHRAAQERGRREFYSWYRIQVCDEVRGRTFGAPG
jgi:heme-degrading monooxygenase HmoA